MVVAASELVGEHDFRSFCVTESAEGQRTVRRIDSIDVSWTEHLGEACLEIRVVGNAFLHSMIRVIAGTLVEVGSGRRDAAWVARAREARSREAAGPTAPAHGLTFWHVTYPDDVWLG
jgi:tRNA pseudouridine38-40 synthase